MAADTASSVHPLQVVVSQLACAVHVSTKTTLVAYCAHPAGAPLECTCTANVRLSACACASHHSTVPMAADEAPRLSAAWSASRWCSRRASAMPLEIRYSDVGSSKPGCDPGATVTYAPRRRARSASSTSSDHR